MADAPSSQGVILAAVGRELDEPGPGDNPLERRNAQLQALLDACTAVADKSTMPELGQAIAFEARSLVSHRAAAAVYGPRIPGGPLELLGTSGESSRTMVQEPDEIDEMIANAVSRATLGWHSAGLVESEGDRAVSSCVVFPLSGNDGVIGCILVETFDADSLGSESVSLVRAFAERAAIALDGLSRVERRLRLAGEQHAIVEGLSDGVIIVDGGHCVTASNPAADRMLSSWALGVSGHYASLSQWPMTRLDGSALPHSELPTVVAVDEGRSFVQRSILLHTSVGDRILTVTAEPLRHPDGSVRAATVVFRDITQQIRLLTELERRAEDLSNEKEAFRRYAQALSQFEDAVIITSAHGRIEEWLGAARKLFDLDLTEAIGQEIYSLLVASERTRTADAIATALGRREGWSGEVTLQAKGGRTFAALLTVSSVQDEAGHVVARVYAAKDISEQKRFRESLARTQRLEGLGTLAGGVAHEINNPLAVLTMNLDALRRLVPPGGSSARGRSEGGTSRAGECADAGGRGPDGSAGGEGASVAPFVIEASTAPQSRPNPWSDFGRAVLAAEPGAAMDKLGELVEESLEVAARIGSIVRTLQTFSPERAHSAIDVSVPWLLDSAAAIAHNEIRHRAVLDKQYGTAPPVRCDPQELEQAILNLLLNACQAIQEGNALGNRITLRVGTEDELVRIDVEDSGVGIPEEVRPRIFDPFFTTRDIGEGAGLGLSVTHDVVRRLGGRIDVDSKVGAGTRVTLWLPPALGASMPVEATPAADGQSKPRLLVVEDEPYLRKAYRRVLKQRYDVTDVGTGEEALVLLRSGTYDMVLCDLQMPGMSGVDLYERSLAERVARSDHFLFVTGGAFTPQVKRFAEQHENRCLLKPVDIPMLMERIDRELKSRS